MKQTFIGTKLLDAIPMTKLEYNRYRGWAMPEGEDPDEQGYLVEYHDGGKANHPDHKGYISWSPKPVLDNSYRPTTGMNFGLALEALKMGHRVARAGWNGKGMWIAYSPGSTGLPAERFWAPQNRKFAEANGPTDVLPCLTMKTAGNEILMGWLASQTDMLADDWQIVEAEETPVSATPLADKQPVDSFKVLLPLVAHGSHDLFGIARTSGKDIDYTDSITNVIGVRVLNANGEQVQVSFEATGHERHTLVIKGRLLEIGYQFMVKVNDQTCSAALTSDAPPGYCVELFVTHDNLNRRKA